MASPSPSSNLLNSNECIDEEAVVKKELNPSLEKYHNLIATLPSHKARNFEFINYGEFWYPKFTLAATVAIQDTFKALPSDIFVASNPKSGTTWIKAIVFAIVNRTRFAFDHHHPLLTSSPHVCLPFLEDIYYQTNQVRSHLEELPRPRLLAMHIPYSALPSSIKNSNCLIVYLCRDPKDTFVSLWHYAKAVLNGPFIPLDEVFEMFCNGCSFVGPIWNHILEYWMASLQYPDNVLFLKYEELKAEPVSNVMRLAKFAGYSFSEEEVKEGVVEKIVKLCSFETLSNVEANKNGIHISGHGVNFKNSAFFRKGEVGDWKELLTQEMAHKLDEIIEQKLKGSGLVFH